jgi:hypothetical protein
MPPGHAPHQQPQGPQAVDFIAPVNVKNGLAFASGWLGLLGLFCLGPLLGIPAIITGVMALKRPELGGKVRAWVGIVCGGICCVVWGLYFAFMFLLHTRSPP